MQSHQAIDNGSLFYYDEIISYDNNNQYQIGGA
jgi:hypothetical protein